MKMESISCLEDARQLLRKWREDGVRRSEDLIFIWQDMLRDEVDGLGDERWMVYEQVAVAAMDTDEIEILDECLDRLETQFSFSSQRVKRLFAMKMEKQENWYGALKLLDQILQQDSTNTAARKRKVAILKAQGEIPKAIIELNKYIKDFMADQEAWMELCDLYISEQEYSKAVFCCEELLLHNPHNHAYFQRYADIRYTQGGFENMEIAKSYYSQAIKLNINNMRALYGLLLTVTQLASSPKCNSQKRNELIKIAIWTSKQISQRYELKSNKRNENELLPNFFLDEMMQQLTISNCVPSIGKLSSNEKCSNNI